MHKSCKNFQEVVLDIQVCGCDLRGSKLFQKSLNPQGRACL